MKIPALLLATAAAKLSAATLAHFDFDSLQTGDPAGILSFMPGQTVAPMPGTGSPAMLMTPGHVTGPDFSYSQVQIVPPPDLLGAARQFELAFDFHLSNLQMRPGANIVRSAEEFTVLFDTPYAERLDFGRKGSTGEIRANDYAVPLYEFTFDAIHHFRALIDLNEGTWSAWLDGVSVVNSMPLHETQRLASVRLNLSDDMTLPGAPSVWLDNITLISIPEPGSASLLLALMPFFGRSRRKGRLH